MHYIITALFVLTLIVSQAVGQELRSIPVKDLSFDFGRWPYPLNEEVGKELNDLAKKYPDIAQVHNIGKTRKGRDLWVMEITNIKTGPGTTKPGMWMDGNVHAEEITGRPYLRYFINRLLKSYGKDEKATRLVDTRTFYVMPIFDADAGDHQLSRHPAWPGYNPDEQQGEDIDGDGYITFIRVKPKPGEEEKRKMWFDRLGLERGYQYYIESNSLEEQKRNPFLNRRQRNNLTGEREGPDFNRNWSAEWNPNEPGAGKRPFELPEVAAVADFINSHQNIYFVYSIHSGGGARSYMVRPPMNLPYETMPPEDNDFYVRIGATWSDLSKGGIMENNYYSFLFNTSVVDPQTGEQRGYSETMHGFMDDWAYMHNGLHSILPEINGSAPDYNGDGWITPVEENKWHWEEKDGMFYSEWKPYNHPIRGRVEVGGPRGIPPALDETLREHSEIQYDYLLHISDFAPDLKIREIKSERISDGNYQIEAVVQNIGWLSTYVTQQAIKIRRDLPAFAKIEVTGGEIVDGEALKQVGHVRGKLAFVRRLDDDSPESWESVEWTIRPTGSGPVEVTVKAWAPKAGRDESSISINR